jgi:hypothetical protein
LFPRIEWKPSFGGVNGLGLDLFPVCAKPASVDAGAYEGSFLVVQLKGKMLELHYNIVAWNGWRNVKPSIETLRNKVHCGKNDIEAFGQNQNDCNSSFSKK